VDESYQHDNLQDLENESALFEHLKTSESNQDAGRSRQETFEDHYDPSRDLVTRAPQLMLYPAEPNDRVSFTLENTSGIKESRVRPGAVGSGNQSMHQFSVH